MVIWKSEPAYNVNRFAFIIIAKIISRIDGIYKDGELDYEATHKKFLLVRSEGTRQVKINWGIPTLWLLECYLKRKNRCVADSGFIVMFCFQKNQANSADAATIKALPASDSSIGAANGHSNSATMCIAAI